MSQPLDTYDEPVDRIEFHFAPSRREFVQVLGAGILIAVAATSAGAQQPRPAGGRGGGGRGQAPAGPITARLHIGQDGVVTVMTGKVECGQGARAELTQAAAEELRLPPERIVLIMADTSLVPNDGTTAGSRSTPSTVPAIRQAAAAARNLLTDIAAAKWTVDRKAVELKDGKVVHGAQSLSYAELASANETVEAFKKNAPANVEVTPVAQWKVMGTSVSRPNGRDIVTGKHQFPSDIVRPGMLYGKVLRAPSYGAKTTAIDIKLNEATNGVVVVEDGTFIGVAAATVHAAEKAIESIAKNVKWETTPGVSSEALYDHLRKSVRGGMPVDANARDYEAAAKKLSAKFDVAYVQHAPMEPRSALAEWNGGKLTVWTATQNPFAVRGELARAFRLTEDAVRVIVPDFGGGFGGKHSGECAVECARLAQAARKPVRLQWTREEEFTWAYFRPAAAIDAAASLDAKNNLATWHFVNVNSGGSAVESPYTVSKGRSQTVQSAPPLRHGSYRALASTANNFARECFMDELAELAGRDSLEFRLAQLGNDRLRAVLVKAAKEFDWTNKIKTVKGIGLACGTEKASYVAACVEIAIEDKRIVVKHVCQAYECGKIINPKNLIAQNDGCIIMGLGPALFEEMKFADGQIKNAAFSDYRVPRMKDLPKIDIHLIDRPDLPSVGAGETPIIAVAPAIANAVYRLTGKRVRTMPIRLGMSGVCAIILAAGRSTRMGRQKLLLPCAGMTMIAHVVRLARAAVNDIIVVIGSDGDQIREALADEPVRFIINDHPDADMLSSVRAGLRAVGDDCAAAMIVLGDQPGITANVMRRLIEEHRGGITVPVYQGKRGHPVIVSMRYRDEILSEFDSEGLRGLLLAHAWDVHEVAVDELAVLQDIDTEEQYRQLPMQ